MQYNTERRLIWNARTRSGNEVSCERLGVAIGKLNIVLVVGGQVHEAGGVGRVEWEDIYGASTVVNAADKNQRKAIQEGFQSART